MNSTKFTNKAQAYALYLLARRPYSTFEIRQKLTRRFSSESAADVITDLTDQGLVDDFGFAKWWQESRQRTKPRSANMLRRELSAKGVSSSCIDMVLGDHSSDEEEATARQVAESFSRQVITAELNTFRRKVWNHLRRRGFSDSIARRAVANAWQKRLVTDT